MKIETASAQKLPEFFASDATVIDVRTRKEFASAHVVGATSTPLDEFDPDQFQKQYGEDKPVYILCQAGKRAITAAERLSQAGHKNVTVITGGTAAAIEAGIDIEYGEASLSIERQVRIATGSLVVVGTILGLWIHPGFLALSALVGAGLVFAGITDTCGMGIMLSKCPWNR
jgi:rhodanese-related sulfurtransferase